MLSLTLLFIISKISCEDFFVSHSADKGNNCTKKFPCKLDDVFNFADGYQNITILFSSGTYDLSKVFQTTKVITANVFQLKTVFHQVKPGSEVVLNSDEGKEPVFALNNTERGVIVLVDGLRFSEFERNFLTTACNWNKKGDLCTPMSIQLRNVTAYKGEPIFAYKTFVLDTLIIKNSTFKEQTHALRLMTRKLRTLLITDTKFQQNSQSNVGIMNEEHDSKVKDVNFVLYGSEFTGNANSNNGGGLYLQFNTQECTNCNMVIKKSKFSDNQALGNGAGMYIDFPQSYIYVYDTIFNQNKCVNGSGIFLYQASEIRFVCNVEFNGNTGTNGAGVFSNVPMYINDTIFDNNVADKIGGALYTTQNLNEVFNSVFRYNKASLFGGAIYTELNTKKICIKECVFDSNYAFPSSSVMKLSSVDYSKGGAIFLNSYLLNDVVIETSLFTKNRAKDRGSVMGIFVQENAIIELSKNRFVGNSYVSDNVVQIIGSGSIDVSISDNYWEDNYGQHSVLFFTAGDIGMVKMSRENITTQNGYLYGFVTASSMHIFTIEDSFYYSNLGVFLRVQDINYVSVTGTTAIGNSKSQDSVSLIKTMGNVQSINLRNCTFNENDVRTLLSSTSGDIIVDEVGALRDKGVEYQCFGFSSNIKSVTIMQSTFRGCNMSIVAKDSYQLDLKILNTRFYSTWLKISNKNCEIEFSNLDFLNGYGIEIDKFQKLEIDKLNFNYNNDIYIGRNLTGGVSLLVTEGNTISISSSNFVGNSFQRGGALHISGYLSDDDIISIDEDTLFRNNSAEFGGAIYIDLKTNNLGKVYTNGANIMANHAIGGGGTYFDYFEKLHNYPTKLIGRCKYNVAQDGKCFLFPPRNFNITNLDDRNNLHCFTDIRDELTFHCPVEMYLYDQFNNLITKYVPNFRCIDFYVVVNDTTFYGRDNLFVEKSLHMNIDIRVPTVSEFENIIETNITMALKNLTMKTQDIKLLTNDKKHENFLLEILLVIMTSITAATVIFLSMVMLFLIIYIRVLKKRNYPISEISGGAVSWAFGIRSKRRNEKEPLLINDSLYGEVYYAFDDDVNENTKYGNNNSRNKMEQKRQRKVLDAAITPFKLFNLWNNSSINSVFQVLLNIPEFVANLGRSNSKLAAKIVKFCRTSQKSEYREVLEHLAEKEYCKTTRNESGDPSEIIKGVISELGGDFSYASNIYKEVFMCDECKGYSTIEEREDCVVPILSCPLEEVQKKKTEITFEKIFVHQNDINKTRRECVNCKGSKIGGMRKIWTKIPKYLVVKIAENGIKNPFLKNAQLNFQNLTKQDFQLSEGTVMSLYGAIFYQSYGAQNGQYFSCLRKISFHYDKKELIEMYFTQRDMTEKEKNEEEFELQRMSKRDIYELIPKELKNKWFYCNDSTIKEIHQKVVEKYFTFKDDYKSVVLIFESKK